MARVRVVEIDADLLRDIRRCAARARVPFSAYLHARIREAIARDVVAADQRQAEIDERMKRRGVKLRDW